ncbi:hypothetical protein HC891_02740 [Candidatus Gracilibacteria bacterium]|nr:hypothetical protein [Candidatus Gracilibacteria bacterium]
MLPRTVQHALLGEQRAECNRRKMRLVATVQGSGIHTSQHTHLAGAALGQANYAKRGIDRAQQQTRALLRHFKRQWTAQQRV